MVSFIPNGLLDSRRLSADSEMKDGPQTRMFIPNGLLGPSRDLTKDTEFKVDANKCISEAMTGALNW